MYFKCNKNELIRVSLTSDSWGIRDQDSRKNHDFEVKELCRVRDVVPALFCHIIIKYILIKIFPKLYSFSL